MPESSHLSAVPRADPAEGRRTVSAPLPAEVDPTPEEAPDLLAALDRGDEEAVHAWVRAHTPDASSLAVYALLLGAGIAGLVEWPALVMTAIGQAVVDRRLGGVEKVVAELRALAEGRSTTRV